MGAIAGIYYADGRPVGVSELERMLSSLAHRGDTGSHAWCNKSAGLASQMLSTTPQSLREKLPLAKKNKKLVLTADARIDNRDELVSQLGFAHAQAHDMGDGELILAAYEQWGDMCPAHLVGDFAFAIWDQPRQALFCARDHMGVKPFYYHHSRHSFIFASEIKALFGHRDVPRRVNEVRVAEYLASMFDDKTITFYSGIARLPPAHMLTVTPEGIQLRSYWSLDSSRELRLGSDQAYADAFREIFIEAVRCRLRSAFPVACSLSGGLDSSSVSCVAQQLLSGETGSRLHTFSIVSDQFRECDERPFINRVLATGAFEPHYISSERMRPLEKIESIFLHQDEPFYAPGLYSTWELYRAVSDQKVKVLLDGHDGDGIVSHGDGRLDELAQAGRWIALAIEARGLAKVHGQSFQRILWSYVRRCKIDPLVSRHRVLKHARSVSQAVNRRIGLCNRASNQASWQAIISPEFARHIGLAERYRSWRETLPASAWGEKQTHLRTLTAGIQPFALEVLDKAAAAFSIELRHPFFDKRLAEFCLALPSDQKLRGGWSRLVLRRAMADFLPYGVQWRRVKTDFFPRFSYGFLIQDREKLDSVIRTDLDLIRDYVDSPAVIRLYEDLARRPLQARLPEVLALWRVVSLALWLRYTRERGGAHGVEYN